MPTTENKTENIQMTENIPRTENIPTTENIPQTEKKTCNTEEVLHQKVVNDHGKLKKKCTVCGKLLHPSSIYKHLHMHDMETSDPSVTKSGQTRSPCPICNNLISTTSMYTHMRIHRKRGDIPEEDPKEDDGKFRQMCKVCGKKCTPGSLRIHMNLHLPERPYSCDMCDKRFNQKTHVDRHKKSQHPK